MRRTASLLAALFLLALPAAAQAHVTFWEASDPGHQTNYYDGTQGVHTFGCDEIVAVDNDPNTAVPSVEYVNVGANAIVNGYRFGASLRTFSAEPHFHGAGGTLYDYQYSTLRFYPYLGYPDDQYLGTKNNVQVNAFGVTFYTLKLHAYGGLWLVKRLC